MPLLFLTGLTMVKSVVERALREVDLAHGATSLPSSQLSLELASPSTALTGPILKSECPIPGNATLAVSSTRFDDQGRQVVREGHLIEVPVKQGFGDKVLKVGIDS